jgi:hypothetical protein
VTNDQRSKIKRNANGAKRPLVEHSHCAINVLYYYVDISFPPSPDRGLFSTHRKPIVNKRNLEAVV